MKVRTLAAALATSVLLASGAGATDSASCEVELVVLGAGQDAGAPQIGNTGDDGPRLLPSSLGVIDRVNGKRVLLDATPAIAEQLAMLDTIAPPAAGSRGRLGIDGVLLTHAHIGHYLGLAYFGQEAAGARNVPVYAMPRMAEFLQSNGPWSQLVELGNIELRAPKPISFRWEMNPWSADVLGGEGVREIGTVFFSDRIDASAMPVAHRDEYSETVYWALRDTGEWSFLYLPDIDQWDHSPASEGGEPSRDDTAIEVLVSRFDMLFLDATFWDDHELEGRDMSAIPHPRVTETMDRLQHLPADQRAKVHFIHYNHTNPIRDPASAESREVIERGFNVARRGDRHCLDEGG